MTEEKFRTGETAAVDEASDESETVETARANTDDTATAPAMRPITTDESSAPALASIVIPHHELQFGDKIGRGGMGIVFAGMWRFRDVAIKEIDGITGKAAHVVDNEVLPEIQIHATLNHTNVLRVFGYSKHQTSFYMVTELMHASVDVFLYAEGGCKMSLEQQNYVIKEFLRYVFCNKM